VKFEDEFNRDEALICAAGEPGVYDKNSPAPKGPYKFD
jgi:hypothetical protein